MSGLGLGPPAAPDLQPPQPSALVPPGHGPQLLEAVPGSFWEVPVLHHLLEHRL